MVVVELLVEVSILFCSLVDSVVTVLYIRGQTCSNAGLCFTQVNKMHFLTTTFIIVTIIGFSEIYFST